MRLLALLVLLLPFALEAGEAGAAPVLGIDLVVLDAVGRETDGPRQPLALYLRRVGAQWARPIALGLNSGFHPGRVVEATIDATAMRLALAFDLKDDAWMTGGPASYVITLHRDPDGSWRGRHAGFFADLAVEGDVVATVHPAYRQLRPPAGLREHPRLLFRQEDLPALQAKAKTPFGQAALAAMQDAAGLALRYRLTGDAALAEESRRKASALMADQTSGSKSVAHRVWSWRAEEISLAFDLCHDAWPADYRQEVAAYLAKVAEQAFFNHGSFTEYISWGLTTRHAPNLLYGPALAGLAILGEPEPPDAAPQAYLDGRDPRSPLPARSNLPEDLPVAPFSDGVMPGSWLYAGPVLPEKGQTAAPALGPDAVPRPGGNLATNAGPVAAGPVPWRLLGTDLVSANGIDLTAANRHAYHSRNCLATVIAVDSTRWLRLEAGLDNAIEDARFLLDGVPLAHRDVIRVAPGRHLFLVDVRMGKTNPWGRIALKPRFTSIAPDQAEGLVTRLAAASRERLAAWEDDRAYHQANQGASPRFRNLFMMGESLMYAFYRQGIGDGGFQAGAMSPMFNHQGPLRYAGPYRTMLGRDCSSHDDVTAFLPRRLMPFVYAAEGPPQVQAINGDATFFMNGWFETRDAGPECFALLHPLSPPAFQPALLWAWNRHVGVRSAEDSAKILVPGGLRGASDRSGKAVEYNTFPVYAFVHYPLGVEAKPPAACLPLTWAAPGQGWYCFRNRWQDGDDAVVQVFAKARMVKDFSPANAGAWRVLALGREWVVGPRDHDGARGTESVVVLPDRRDLNDQACGVVTWSSTQPDGSGGVTIDLDQVYASARTVGKGRAPLYSDPGSVLLAPNLASSGISGRRAFAVDFSGKCGAPVLLAVLDEVRGDAGSVWLHQVESISEAWGRFNVQAPDGTIINPNDAKRKIPWINGLGSSVPEGWKILQHRDPKVPEVWTPSGDTVATVSGSGFVLAKGDAALHATFAPTDGFALAPRTVTTLHNATSGHGLGVTRVAAHAIAARSPQGCYFAVMTIQRGPAPAVRVDGKGLAATFTIGSRRIRWDGAKVVIE